jgi:hypothetical protein
VIATTETDVKRFLDTVEGDLFSDIVTRCCVLDAIIRHKLLTRAQVNKILALRTEIEASESRAMAVALGAVEAALDDLDPEGDISPARDAFMQDNVEACIAFLEDQEKKKPTRSEKLGPLSYPLF